MSEREREREERERERERERREKRERERELEQHSRDIYDNGTANQCRVTVFLHNWIIFIIQRRKLFFFSVFLGYFYNVPWLPKV